ncbi:MAG: outer membrane lipoprotein-sorting protein [Bacteroidales bacterium]
MKKTCLYLIASILLSISINAQDAREIVKKADAKMRGEESSFSIMNMQIIRPAWERTISFKSWTKGTIYSLAIITSPAKEKGQAFLKHGNEMWNWNPVINRMIKLPPSMLSQGWMGSDFTNDDLLNESSIIVDYNHTLRGSETISGKDCFVVQLIPKDDAGVVWGKLILWITKDDDLQLKAEYYDEDNYLVKTETGSEIRNMNGRVIPTRFELVPADKKDHKTVVTLEEVKFNIPIQENFFSQQNMKQVK